MTKTWDSDNRINCSTPVVNYKSDATTRDFFVSQIGLRFHFTSYLRQFARNKNQSSRKITYGDLVKGWLAEELRRRNPRYKTIIGKQFKYNQFIRDYFLREKNKTLQDTIKAWKMVRNVKGRETYAYYRSVCGLY